MDNNKTIELTTIIKRNDTKFLANKLGEEMVMMNMGSGDFVSMNHVGADIWELSAEPIAVSDLINRLLNLYAITIEQCTDETLQFLRASMQQGLFIINN